MNTRLIKQIKTNRFQIDMIDVLEGGFLVEYTVDDKSAVTSELIFDYHMADYMFDIKLRELEGT